jgi:hypothetical protein
VKGNVILTGGVTLSQGELTVEVRTPSSFLTCQGSVTTVKREYNWPKLSIPKGDFRQDMTGTLDFAVTNLNVGGTMDVDGRR